MRWSRYSEKHIQRYNLQREKILKNVMLKKFKKQSKTFVLIHFLAFLSTVLKKSENFIKPIWKPKRKPRSESFYYTIYSFSSTCLLELQRDLLKYHLFVITSSVLLCWAPCMIAADTDKVTNLRCWLKYAGQMVKQCGTVLQVTELDFINWDSLTK